MEGVGDEAVATGQSSPAAGPLVGGPLGTTTGGVI